MDYNAIQIKYDGQLTDFILQIHVMKMCNNVFGIMYKNYNTCTNDNIIIIVSAT